MGIISVVVAGRADTLEFRAKQREVIIRRLCNMNMRQLQPGL